MENPRPEKVAVVDEVREKLSSTEAVVFTEYRGLTVRDLQDLRGALREAGGEYKVYKNTLVRRATAELDLDLDDVLTGPTALAIVGDKPDGSPGDAVLVAKALKAFAKGNENLVLKGGRLGDQMLDNAAILALADVAPREELLARLAGGMAAPMTNMARLLQALPQKMAYAISALIEQGGAPGAPPADSAGEGTADDTTSEESTDDPAAEAGGSDDTPAAEAGGSDDTPAAEAGGSDDTDEAEASAEAGVDAAAEGDDAAGEQE